MHTTLRGPLLLAGVLLGSASLSGCNPSIGQAKEALERTLKDPGSVQYQDVVAYSENVVCGQYNAKNEMGGYVGFRRFITLNGVLTSGDEHANYMNLCNNTAKGKIELDEAELGKFGFDVPPAQNRGTYWEVTVYLQADRYKVREIGDYRVELSKVAKEILSRNIVGERGWLTTTYEAQKGVETLLTTELRKHLKDPEIKNVRIFTLPALKP